MNNKLNFEYHVNELWKKENKKLHDLARITQKMGINQQKMVMKAFVRSQFAYCPLMWIVELWNI